MKNYTKKLLAGLLLLISAPVFGGNTEEKPKKDKKIQIEGEVYDPTSRLKNAEIIIYEGNSIIGRSESKRRGKFSVSLEENKNYVIEIKKEGYCPKRVSISTELPKENLAQIPALEFEVELIENDKYKGVDQFILDFPSALISYNEETGQFEHNSQYTNEMFIEQNLLLYEAFLKKELDPKYSGRL